MCDGRYAGTSFCLYCLVAGVNMDRERAKELLPIIQAFAEGKVVQRQITPTVWIDDLNPAFEYDNSRWRIKPEKRAGWGLKELRQGECQWSYEDGLWIPECGGEPWNLYESPEKTGMRYCMYCGNKIKEKAGD